MGYKSSKRKGESWGGPERVSDSSEIAQLSWERAEVEHQAPWLPVQCSCLIKQRTGPRLFALRWGGREAMEFPGKWCAVQGKDSRSDNKGKFPWQGTMEMRDFKHSKSSRALWKTGSTPNASCPLCLEFSTWNSISCTTDIITVPQGTEQSDNAPQS